MKIRIMKLIVLLRLLMTRRSSRTSK